MPARKFRDLRSKLTPEARARVEARVKQTIEEMTLHQLRQAREVTQATLAEAMNTSQGEISKIEKRTDCYISTIRSYVEGLNGELDIVVRFADGQVFKINQFSDLANA